MRARPAAASSDSVLRIAVVVLGVAATCMVVFAIALVATNGRLLGHADDAPARTAGKLAGATETVDGNGVVHGTTPSGITYVVYGRGSHSKTPGTISFAAVGDVLATEMNFDILDGYAGEVGDGVYSFAPYYQEVAGTVQGFDIAFINQETPMAGSQDGFEYTGYPNFNTPESSADAFVDAGFNLVNFGSNHTWDMGQQGILNTQAHLAQHPGLMVVGSYASQADRRAVHMIERDGVDIAFLSYCYGDNAFASIEDFPNTYYSCPFDKSEITAEVLRAKQVADAVVVYMHWGDEYVTEPSAQQLDYAQFLADLDVDLVIGSHAHILQTIRIYEGPSGKQIPVVFGLSDFISGWTLTDTILSAMFTCDFVWKDGKLTVDNLACYPLIEYSDGGDVYVRFIKDMTSADMENNLRTEDVADDEDYLRSYLDALEMDVAVLD